MVDFGGERRIISETLHRPGAAIEPLALLATVADRFVRYPTERGHARGSRPVPGGWVRRVDALPRRISLCAYGQSSSRLRSSPYCRIDHRTRRLA